MNTENQELCIKCKGRGFCGKVCPILQNIKQFLPKKEMHFSGSSPPEIFVGRYGYPNIYTGILSPQSHEETEKFSSSEFWVKNKLSINQILELRGQLIYGQFKSNIKDARLGKKFTSAMQEISLSEKPVSAEFFLHKPLDFKIQIDKSIPVIGNPAPLKHIRLEENPKVEKKVEYIFADNELKANEGVKELYQNNISVEHIIKLLSAGMLGRKEQRIFVPTRWAITAVDDILSKKLIEKIKNYPEINEIMVFNSEFVGNHYEFLLIPDKFSFEVIEAKMSGSIWNPMSKNNYFMQDFESFLGRKKYAENVSGAYYANRLALCEYLDQIKKQGSCVVMREAREAYWAPLGVGILRETSREAFQKIPEKFNSMKEALEAIQKRMKIPVQEFKEKSEIIKNHGKQKKLTSFFKSKSP
ncbi:MAG: Nre family DNA repair protein [archaeon]|nr:Nre family DNA repair protein [archaeon]